MVKLELICLGDATYFFSEKRKTGGERRVVYLVHVERILLSVYTTCRVYCLSSVEKV